MTIKSAILTLKEVPISADQRDADESGTHEQFDEPDEDACTSRHGHVWVYSGTAYGGDDESYMGEGRCYCEHCGADGDA